MSMSIVDMYMNDKKGGLTCVTDNSQGWYQALLNRCGKCNKRNILGLEFQFQKSSKMTDDVAKYIHKIKNQYQVIFFA